MKNCCLSMLIFLPAMLLAQGRNKGVFMGAEYYSPYSDLYNTADNYRYGIGFMTGYEKQMPGRLKLNIALYYNVIKGYNHQNYVIYKPGISVYYKSILQAISLPVGLSYSLLRANNNWKLYLGINILPTCQFNYQLYTMKDNDGIRLKKVVSNTLYWSVNANVGLELRRIINRRLYISAGINYFPDFINPVNHPKHIQVFPQPGFNLKTGYLF